MNHLEAAMHAGVMVLLAERQVGGRWIEDIA
jgi:hypothetical protein